MVGMPMFGLLTRRMKETTRPAEVAPGVRLYVIGDIHGRLDLLLRLYDHIVKDAQREPAGDRRVICLGDYVDRGPSSREVLEFLMQSRKDLPATHLLGNHEAMLLRFLEDSSVGMEWLTYGGLATLMSYGVSVKGEGSDEQRMLSAQRALNENFPVG